MSVVYWLTDWLGWIFVELADIVPGERMSGVLYRVRDWLYGVRP